MEKATLEIINNVPYAVLPDGRKVKYSDILAYNNPGMQYDDVTLDVIVATPTTAEAAAMPAAGLAPDVFGDTTMEMASPYFRDAADLAANAGRRPTYFEQPLMQGLERTGQYVGDMGLAGLNAIMGGMYGGAGLLGEAFGGDRQGERSLARDVAGMIDVAGPAPEGRMLGLLTDAGAGRAAATDIAERLTQPGPMPTTYANPIPGLLGERASARIPKLQEDLGPNDAWLQGKLAKAEKNRLEFGNEGGLLGNIGGGDGVTGWFSEPIMLNPNALVGVRGLHGEEAFRDTGRKLTDLQKAIAEEGYKPSPIVVVVREDGVPFISEGNHRLAEAIKSGRPEIPVEIKYMRGAQEAEGLMNPNNLPFSSPILPPASNAQKTQIAGTFPTYKKALGLLDAEFPEGKTLDFGAGLGMSRDLGFDTYEPFPRAGFDPTYRSASDIPDASYDRLTNLNVLNVVPREIRDQIVSDIGRVIKPGGVGVITTRGRDVMAAKGVPGPEPMSMVTSADTYQKGFSQKELQEYLQSVLGEAYGVSPVRLGPAGAMIRRNY